MGAAGRGGGRREAAGRVVPAPPGGFGRAGGGEGERRRGGGVARAGGGRKGGVVRRQWGGGGGGGRRGGSAGCLMTAAALAAFAACGGLRQRSGSEGAVKRWFHVARDGAGGGGGGLRAAAGRGGQAVLSARARCWENWVTTRSPGGQGGHAVGGVWSDAGAAVAAVGCHLAAWADWIVRRAGTRWQHLTKQRECGRALRVGSVCGPRREAGQGESAIVRCTVADSSAWTHAYTPARHPERRIGIGDAYPMLGGA